MAVLIDQYLEWLRVRDCTERTIGARNEILNRVDRDLPCGIEHATYEELEAWLYRPEWSRSTKSTYYGAIRSFFVWATNPLDARLDFDPTVMLPRPKARPGIPKPVSDQELAHILTHAAEPFLTWSKLAAYEGLRCIEIARLHREHITEELTYVWGKGDKPGVVPTHPIVWRAVQDLPAGPIAWTKTGLRASARYISITALLHFRRDLGMPRGTSMHRFRHWYCTNILRQTRNVRTAQVLARHASITSTVIYTLIADEERRLAVQALPIPTENL